MFQINKDFSLHINALNIKVQNPVLTHSPPRIGYISQNSLISESQHNSSLKGPLEVSSPTFCSKQDQLGQITSLRTFCTWVLTTSQDGEKLHSSVSSLLNSLTATYPVFPLLFQLTPIVSHPATVPHCDRPGFIFLTTSS